MDDEPRQPQPPQPSDTPPAEPAAARPEPFDSAQDRPVEGSPGPVRPEPVEGLRQPSVEDQLADMKAEADRLRNNWQRAEADFQNYKRRAEQERDENRRFAMASLIINLLPILDDFERAFNSLDSRLAGLSWFDGIYLIYRKLQQLLENVGVTAIRAEGQPFDPRYHEAVSHVEGEDGKVLAEVQRGYQLHDRVLRPAMVVVGKGAGEQGTGNKEQEEGSGKGEGESGEEQGS